MNKKDRLINELEKLFFLSKVRIKQFVSHASLEDIQSTMLKESPYDIRHIAAPSERLQCEVASRTAGKHGIPGIAFINNPCEKAQLAAIRSNPDFIDNITSPTENVMLELLRREYDYPYFDYIPWNMVPYPKVARKMVRLYPYWIFRADSSSAELQTIAVRKAPGIIKYLSHPCEEAQLLAVERNPFHLLALNRPPVPYAGYNSVLPHETVQERHPSPEVCKKALEAEFGTAKGIQVDERIIGPSIRYFERMAEIQKDYRVELPDTWMDSRMQQEAVSTLNELRESTGILLSPEKFLALKEERMLAELNKTASDYMDFADIIGLYEGDDRDWLDNELTTRSENAKHTCINTMRDGYRTMLTAMGIAAPGDIDMGKIWILDDGTAVVVTGKGFYEAGHLPDSMKEQHIDTGKITGKQWDDLFQGEPVQLPGNGDEFVLAKSPDGYTLKPVKTGEHIVKDCTMEL